MTFKENFPHLEANWFSYIQLGWRALIRRQELVVFVLLLVTGTALISFIVGLVLGYLTERGLEPGGGPEGERGGEERQELGE